MFFHGEFAIAIRNPGAYAARAAVRKQGEIFAGLQAQDRLVQAERAPFDEVIARAACAKLIYGGIFQRYKLAGGVPGIIVQYRMLCFLAACPFCAHAEGSFIPQRVFDHAFLLSK